MTEIDFEKVSGASSKERNILEAALNYREMGFSVIPVQKNKKPYIAWEKYQKEKASPDVIRQWWKKWPQANVGIITGKVSNSLVVADADSAHGFDKLNELIPEGLKFPMAATPGNGYHFYFYSENGLGNATRFIKDCDFRAEGGYVVAPPSKGLNGKTYYWVPGHELLADLIPPPLPAAIEKALSKVQIPTEPNKELVNFNKNTRDETIFHLALNLAKGGMPRGEVETATLQFARSCKPPFPDKEALIKVTSAFDRVQKKEGDLTQNVAAHIKEYLFDEFDGGVFKISDLRRELGLNDNTYTLARQCVKRMVDQGLVQKHGHQLGCYRVVDRKKKTINWAETEAQASNLVLPGNLHEVVTIRNGDLIAFAGFKNHNKTGIAIETVRLNLDKFKVHFFITEYRARMKRRLLDFGVDLNHPNFNAYQMDKTDYIPDKIESGSGVLNVIDHLPNLDNFYLVGKYQDEIHRALDGAICMITHQKLKPNDLDAIGKSFWRITPTLAVTLFWDDANEYQGKMRIVKAKEPGEGRFSVNGLVLEYSLKRGREFKYDLEGWK